MIKVYPSILAADLLCLERDIADVLAAGADEWTGWISLNSPCPLTYNMPSQASLPISVP